MQERAYGDLKLSNIGKLRREKAEFHHRNNLGPSGKKFLLRKTTLATTLATVGYIDVGDGY